MKRARIRFLTFELLIFIVFLVNSFVSNILKGYMTAIFLVLLLVLFRLFFGFTKDRHRYVKDIIFDILIVLIIFFILFYILGIFIGFARPEDYYSFYGFNTFIFPLVLNIIIKEILRSKMLSKTHDDKILIATTCILFICLDVTSTIYYNNFDSPYNTFIFVALYLLPSICTNLACTYVSLKVGYKPIILYLLVVELCQYLLPIIPNPDKYLTSVIRLILPAILWYRVYEFFKFESDREFERDTNKFGWVYVLIPSILIVVMVYFTSGYFRYHAIAIATGSMEPKIHKGDVVVIEKMNKNYNTLKKGDIIAFKYNGVVIVHRIIRIIKNENEYYFYTKGDANNVEDGYPVKEDMIVGIIHVKIPYLGIPTVWVNEL